MTNNWQIDLCSCALFLGSSYILAALILANFFIVHFFKRRWRKHRLTRLRIKFHRFSRRLLTGDYRLNDEDYFTINELLILYYHTKSKERTALLRNCLFKAGVSGRINKQLLKSKNRQRVAMLEQMWPFLTLENKALLETMLTDRSKHLRLAAKIALNRAGLNTERNSDKNAREILLHNQRVVQLPRKVERSEQWMGIDLNSGHTHRELRAIVSHISNRKRISCARLENTSGASKKRLTLAGRLLGRLQTETRLKKTMLVNGSKYV